MMLALLGAPLLTACEPCAGTANCSTAPRVSYSGRTVVYRENRPIGGVTLEFARTGGAELTGGRLVATSDGDGWFRLVGEVAGEGDVVGDLTVRPPAPFGAYTVPGVRLRQTSVRGDGGDLGRIVADPYLAVIGEVRSLATRGVLPNAAVRFRRTGGVAISPAAFDWVTDAGGRFFLNAQPATFGTIEGELTVQSTALPKPYAIPFRFTTEWRDRVPEAVTLVRLGNGLVYVGELVRRGSLKGIAGAEIEFVRTGGIAADPERLVVRSDTAGRFPLVLSPSGAGEVVGDLTVRPPAPLQPFTVRGLRLATFDRDTVLLAGRWFIGEQVFGALELFARATQRPLDSGVVAVFRRTGGIRIDPDSQVWRTNREGRIPIRAAALESGTVTGDVEVRLPAPFRTDTVRGVRLASRDDDTQTFLGRAGVGAWLGYVGRVVAADGRPVADARVEFRRTGGIQVAQPYSTVSNADGYFPLTMAPLGEGEVVGDVVITPPAPFRATTVPGVRLATYATDEVKAAGTWAVP